MGEIKIITNILKSNMDFADVIKKILKEKGIFAINLMSSPGSGKTSILEKLIDKLKGEIRIGVIEGDIYTTKDAERIEAHGVSVVQINTSGACHLDANMIKIAMDELELDKIDLLVIENVGNLVCPAEFEVGEDIKLSVLSTTEGNDKPLKYPLMFEKSNAVILNKIDMLSFTDFNIEEFEKDINSLNANAKIFKTSCTKNEGIDELSSFIKEKVKEKNKLRGDVYVSRNSGENS